MLARVLEKLLECLIPSSDGDEILGDLREGRRDAGRRGRWAAGWHVSRLAGMILYYAVVRAMNALRRRGRQLWRRSSMSELTHPPRAGVRILRLLIRGSSTSDLRFAARSLRRQPGFAIVAVGALAVGIAVNAIGFAILDAALWRPLPVPDADRLVSVRVHMPQEDRTPYPSIEQFLQWRARVADSVDAMVLYQGRRKLVEWPDGRVDDVSTQPVSEGFFSLLGAGAIHGRTLAAGDYEADATLVAVVSHDFWQRTMGADPGALGDVLRVNGLPYVIVGVLSPDFQFDTFSHDVFLPLRVAGPGAVDPAGDGGTVIARLRQGATEEQLVAELTAAILPDPDRDERPAAQWIAAVEPLRVRLYGWVGERFGPLIGVVAFVLLLVIANLANLTLVRATNRRRELAVRAALGAGRWQLARVVIAEVVVVAIAAAGLGLLLTSWGMSILVRMDPLGVASTHLKFDYRVAMAVLGIAAVAAALAAAWPAFSAFRTDYRRRRNDALRGRGGDWGARGRRTLVVAQVACAMLLVTGAGLLTKTIVRMYQYDPGFDTRNVLTFDTTLPDRYADDASRLVAMEQIVERIEALPGVVSVGAVAFGDYLASRNETEGGITLEGQQERLPQQGSWIDAALEAGSYSYSHRYFETQRIPVIRGRSFTDADYDRGTPTVALINEEAARRWWPEANGDVIGGRFKLGPPSSPNPWLTVVGVVATTRTTSVRGLERAPTPSVHLPLTAGAGTELATMPAETGTFYFYLRTDASPRALVPSARAALRDVDPDLLMRRPADQYLSMLNGISYYRASADVVLTFATFGLVLAAMGLYGTVACSVVRRTREIGIRIALGAEAADVLRTVMSESVMLAGLGIAAGLALSIGLTRALESMLFGVNPLDPYVFAAVATFFVAVVAAATYLPARRATRVDPMIALRID
jgi:predicted permease